MTVAHESLVVDVEELDVEQARELFEKACQDLLGVSAEEFLKRHEVDSYPSEWGRQEIAELEFLLPYAR